jgi:hypothetical protein
MTYLLPFELDSCPEKQFEARLKIKYNTYYDGIGSYSYHGQRCFDKGKLTAEIENYKLLDVFADGDKIPYLNVTQEILDIIEQKFDSDSVQDDIRMEILDNLD